MPIIRIAKLMLSLALILGADRAAAGPSEAQVAAIKSNCRSDYMSYCWSVPRGGPEAVQCLKKNLAKLSPGCQQAVKDITENAEPAGPPTEAKSTPAPAESGTQASPPAAGTAPPSAPQQKSPHDAAAEAPAAPPAPAAAKTETPPQAAPASAATGSKSAAKPEATTQTAPAKQRDAFDSSKAEPAATTASAPAGSPAPAFIPPRKKIMLLRFCRDDFKAHCPGVEVGGGRAVACLNDNLAALSEDCRAAVAKLAQ